MSQAQILKPDEIVVDRPFTNPRHSQDDLAVMRHMAQQLVDTYDDPVVCDFAPGKKAVCQSDPMGRHFRIYYVQPRKLFSLKNLTAVGFFGFQRPGADIGPLIQADKQFEQEFHRHPGLLSLSTVRLPGGDFGNLVMFSDPDSVQTWNMSKLHHEIVPRISPPYYRSIRLNNALLPQGLDAPDVLTLLRVKYIDFTTEPHWRAVRELAAAS
jgi:hypothetical protein